MAGGADGAKACAAVGPVADAIGAAAVATGAATHAAATGAATGDPITGAATGDAAGIGTDTGFGAPEPPEGCQQTTPE